MRRRPRAGKWVLGQAFCRCLGGVLHAEPNSRERTLSASTLTILRPEHDEDDVFS